VSAHKRAHTQVRPYNSFSYFYERNLVLNMVTFLVAPPSPQPSPPAGGRGSFLAEFLPYPLSPNGGEG